MSQNNLDDTHATGPDLRRRYGITDVALRKWMDDATLDFPRPLVIRGRMYFVWREILAWEAHQRAPASKVSEAA